MNTRMLQGVRSIRTSHRRGGAVRVASVARKGFRVKYFRGQCVCSQDGCRSELEFKKLNEAQEQAANRTRRLWTSSHVKEEGTRAKLHLQALSPAERLATRDAQGENGCIWRTISALQKPCVRARRSTTSAVASWRASALR